MNFILAFFELAVIAKFFSFNHTMTHDFGGCVTPERGCVTYVKEHLKLKMVCDVPAACGPHYYIIAWNGDSFFGSNEICMATKHSPVMLEEYSIAGNTDVTLQVSHWKIRRVRHHNRLATAAKPLMHQCLQSWEDEYQEHALPLSYPDYDNGVFQWRHFGYDQFSLPVPDGRVPLLLSANRNVDVTASRKLMPFLIYYGQNGRIQYHAEGDKFLFYGNGVDPESELLKTYAEVRLDQFSVRLLNDFSESTQRLMAPIRVRLDFSSISHTALPYTGKYQYDNETNYDCDRGACTKRRREVGNLISVKATERNMFTDIIDKVGVMFEGIVTFITDHLARVTVDTTGDLVADLREYFAQNTGFDFMTIAWVVFLTIYVCYKLTDSFIFGAGLFVLLTITLFENFETIDNYISDGSRGSAVDDNVEE